MDQQRRGAIVEGPLGRAVFVLAWPVIVTEGLHTAFHVIDIAWIRGLGPAATAAATTATFAAWIMLGLAQLITTGLTAHVSHAIGSGQRERAERAVTQALHLAAILGVAVAVLGWVTAPGLFRLIGGDGEVHRLGVIYLRITALGAPATFLYLGGAAVMRATGNTWLPMLITAAAVAANVVLAPLLVYTFDLGIAGAPLATIVCQTGAAAAYAYLAVRQHPSLPFAAGDVGRLDWSRIGSLARVGTPYALLVSGFALVYLVFSHLAAGLGTIAIAVVGLGNRLESICYLPSDGFAAAAATVVGQNLGAGRPERAARGAWTAVAAMTSLSVPLALAFWFIPDLLLAIFTDDAALIARGVPYVKILALCQVAVGVEGTLSGGFVGAGDTMPPLVIHLAFAALRIPAAWLALGWWGLDGIAITITVTCVIRAAILVAWFRRNDWQRVRLGG